MTWEVPIEVAKSPTHGTGVFARCDIPRGTVLWRYDPSMIVCTEEELRSYEPAKLYRALLAGYLHVPTDVFLWYQDGMQFVNHADDPIANMSSTEWAPRVEDEFTIATRDIKAGEEILEDYGFWTVDNTGGDHWLRRIYHEACPQHYDFMQMLGEQRRAA